MNFIKLSVLAAGLLSSFAACASTPILDEHFDAPGFQNSLLLPDSWSDNWMHTDYYTINNYNGWSFGSSAYVASDGVSNSGILLNETGTGKASKLVTGLTVGQSYTLNFDLWGDNAFASPYGLKVDIAGASKSWLKLVYAPGYYKGAGTQQSLSFIADSSSTELVFTQKTPFGGGSPIIDNVQISAVPEPASYALMLGGLALLGMHARKRRRGTVEV